MAVCPHCHLSFSRKDSLLVHLRKNRCKVLHPRTKYSEAKDPCTTCGRVVLRKHMQRHMRTHDPSKDEEDEVDADTRQETAEAEGEPIPGVQFEDEVDADKPRETAEAENEEPIPGVRFEDEVDADKPRETAEAEGEPVPRVRFQFATVLISEQGVFDLDKLCHADHKLVACEIIADVPVGTILLLEEHAESKDKLISIYYNEQEIPANMPPDELYSQQMLELASGWADVHGRQTSEPGEATIIAPSTWVYGVASQPIEFPPE